MNERSQERRKERTRSVKSEGKEKDKGVRRERENVKFLVRGKKALIAV